MDVLAITIEGGGIAVRLGPPGGAPGLHASGLAGWYGTPDGKWDLTERQHGDGAFAIEPSRVAYSSRTVAVDGYALGRTMAEALSSLAPLGAMTHRLVSIVVDDGVAETYATGALTAEVGKGVRGGAVTFTLTVVCPDPRRYSTQTQTAYMNPAASSDSGLVYSGSGVLTLPLAYSGETAAGAGTATIANGGTATAYPRRTPSSRFTATSAMCPSGTLPGPAPSRTGAAPRRRHRSCSTASRNGKRRGRDEEPRAAHVAVNPCGRQHHALSHRAGRRIHRGRVARHLHLASED